MRDSQLRFLKGLAGKDFLGRGNLEDFLLKKKKGIVMGYLREAVFNIYTLYCIMDSETSLIPTGIR